MKSLVRSNSCQFNIVCRNFFLHYLLQGTQGQFFCFVQGHSFRVRFFQVGLCSLATSSNCLGLVSDKSTTWIRKVQLRPFQFIVPGQQERHTKRTGHSFRGVTVASLTKTQCQITHRLCEWLNSDGFVVRESMILRFYTSMIDQGFGIGDESTHGSTNMAVNLGDFLYTGRIQKGRRQTLFDRQNGTLLGLNADCGRSEFNGFNGIFDLKKTPFWRERIHSAVVF
mmetsp:Transcript_9861/g.18009  ORF Transcript_9861/g.18009 Transcript_9861/m.18009 type:complete len:225 (+) Transcript_9861:905-1579(+)